MKKPLNKRPRKREEDAPEEDIEEFLESEQTSLDMMTDSIRSIRSGSKYGFTPDEILLHFSQYFTSRELIVHLGRAGLLKRAGKLYSSESVYSCCEFLEGKKILTEEAKRIADRLDVTPREVYNHAPKLKNMYILRGKGPNALFFYEEKDENKIVSTLEELLLEEGIIRCEIPDDGKKDEERDEKDLAEFVKNVRNPYIPISTLQSRYFGIFEDDCIAATTIHKMIRYDILKNKGENVTRESLKELSDILFEWRPLFGAAREIAGIAKIGYEEIKSEIIKNRNEFTEQGYMCNISKKKSKTYDMVKRGCEKEIAEYIIKKRDKKELSEDQQRFKDALNDTHLSATGLLSTTAYINGRNIELEFTRYDSDSNKEVRLDLERVMEKAYGKESKELLNQIMISQSGNKVSVRIRPTSMHMERLSEVLPLYMKAAYNNIG